MHKYERYVADADNRFWPTRSFHGDGHASECQDYGTPTGTVTFQVGTTTLGSAALSDGKATLTYSGLPPGTYAILADYQGDTNFNSSTSAAAPFETGQTVQFASTTVALSSSADPSSPKQSVTLTADGEPCSSWGWDTDL